MNTEIKAAPPIFIAWVSLTPLITLTLMAVINTI